jgi:hypothetical protein
MPRSHSTSQTRVDALMVPALRPGNDGHFSLAVFSAKVTGNDNLVHRETRHEPHIDI